VILVDANLLVYASMSRFPQHDQARSWLDNQLSGQSRVGLPWPSLLAFMRVTTNSRIFQPALSMTTAWRQAEAWLDCGVAWIPSPTDRHTGILANLLGAAAVEGNLVHDAHLAALAIEHGLELCSADGDFGRFSGLRWTNPLAS
jgi:hypothetical protein